MNLVIIDYGSGNLRSVENSFRNCVSVNNLKFKIIVSNNLNIISDADHLILPGVGSFPDCKNGLLKIIGLFDLLTNEVLIKRKKFLGICVGMQLMADYSFEKKNFRFWLAEWLFQKNQKKWFRLSWQKL